MTSPSQRCTATELASRMERRGVYLIDVREPMEYAGGHIPGSRNVPLAQLAPAWILLSWFVGAGLVFAGITGWCGMAQLLARMPWNRVAPLSGAPGR